MEASCDYLDIPPFPPVAARLLQALGEEQSEIRRIVDLMRSDPGLSAGLLQRANSAEYGFEQRVDSLHHAIMLLGLRRVRQLALTVATGAYVKAYSKNEDLRLCWRHMLATALAAEEIARAAGVHEERAYVAGLMHDVGRMGLLIAFPERYSVLLHRAADEAVDMLECERYEFGVDHCEAGRMLAEHWKLPQDLAVVAGRHHDPPDDGEFDLARLSRAACLLAAALDFDEFRMPRKRTYDEVLELLPAAGRQALRGREEALRQAIDSKINAYDAEDLRDSGEDLEPESEHPAEAEDQEPQPAARTSVPVLVAAGFGAALAGVILYWTWLRFGM